MHIGGIRSTPRMLLEGLEGIVLLALAVLTWPLTRRLVLDLGSTPEERSTAWPGDGLLPSIELRTTRALDVRAPAADVWPWLLQIGLGRGGFHSYELLERIAGIKVRNLERIEPHLQQLELGDEVLLHPTAPGLHVALLEPRGQLCFRTWRDAEDLAERDPTLAGSWSLYLVPSGADSCRLILRSCKHERRPRRTVDRMLARFIEEPLDLVMEQRLLRTVRRLARRRRVRGA